MNTHPLTRAQSEQKLNLLSSSESNRLLLDKLTSWKAKPWSPETHYILPHKLQLQIQGLFLFPPFTVLHVPNQGIYLFH